MKNTFDIDQVINAGKIADALVYEQALLADRKLRLMAKNNPAFRTKRKALRDLIEAYEKVVWNDFDVSLDTISQSDKAAKIAEMERQFFENRKKRIRSKLKEFELNQAQLGLILGHKSKTHMSELMNGIKPFTLKDIILIHRLFGIEIKDLAPTILPETEVQRINACLQELQTSLRF